RLLLERLHENGELEPPGPRDAFAAGESDEFRRVDAVVAEDFFGDALVLAKSESGRTATGERHAVHFQERNDVLVERAVVLELVGEIENNVRLEALQFLPEQVEVVENRQLPGVVTEVAERRQDVRLRLPILGLQFRAQILVERRGGNGVEQREN